MSLAREGFDAFVMMAAAVFADAGKAISWIYFAHAVKQRQVLAALASFIIFVACLFYAVAGSLGYVAMNRAQSSADQEGRSGEATQLDQEIKRKERLLSELGMTEPAASINKRLEGLKQDKRFAGSQNCKDVTVENTRQFCVQLAQLEAKEKRAERAEKLEQEIESLRHDRKKYAGVAKVEKGDFQASLIAQLTSIDRSTIQLSLALLFVIMVESGACFLLFLSLNFSDDKSDEAVTSDESATQPAAPNEAIGVKHDVGETALTVTTQERTLIDTTTSPTASTELTTLSTPDDFIAFVEAEIRLVARARTEIGEVATAYKDWCRRWRCQPLDDEAIVEALVKFCRIGRIRQERQGRRIYLIGVAIVASGEE